MASMTRRGTCVPPGPSRKTGRLPPTGRFRAGNWARMVSGSSMAVSSRVEAEAFLEGRGQEKIGIYAEPELVPPREEFRLARNDPALVTGPDAHAGGRCS